MSSVNFVKKALSSFLCKASEKMTKPLTKPLGRWSHCGDKKYVQDIIEFKIQQKQRRQFLLETGTDPYQAILDSQLSQLKIEEEEYMYPYIVQH